MFQRRALAGQYSVERMFADIRRAMPDDIEIVLQILPHESRRIVNRIRNMLFARRERGDVNHIAGDVHYIALALPAASTLLTILDLVSVDRMTGLRRLLLILLWYRWPVRRCAAVTVISNWTRGELLRLLPNAESKVAVIPCPVSPQIQASPPRHRERPILLQVGVAQNKNLFNVADAIRDLNVHLRVIGALDRPQVRHLESLGLEFSTASGLSDIELAEEYANSDIVIFASTYEGFGLPILEAQAAGRPLVTSAVASMPEVAGEAALLVDPLDVASIRGALRLLIEDAALRDSLVEAGFENVRLFTADLVARDYAVVYRRLARRGNRALAE